MSDATVTLTIDGKEITVPKGTLIIRAAEQLGTIIPRFCDHPLLDPIGACRQCIVEVEGQRKPMTACTTECGDGWEVRTHLTSNVAEKAQEAQLEFLLINHPLDCPMCDKGGECPLQDQAMAHGRHESRFVDEKRRYDKPVAVSPQILLDRERCVLCARCTRFADEISGDPFIELFERGALEQVAIYEDEPYNSYFSGNVIQICPVGALTSTDYRFKARPFDLRSARSLCDCCSSGCSITVQSRRGEIERQLARTNMATNEAWISDKARFAFGHLTADTRIAAPRVGRGDDAETVDWAKALLAVRDALQSDDGAIASAAVLSGGRLADEDAYTAGKFARTVLGTGNIDFRTRFASDGETDELAALLGRQSATFTDVEHAGVVLTVGLDPEEECPPLYLRLRKAWRNHKAKLVGVGASTGTLHELLWRRLPTTVGAEATALTQLLDAVQGDGQGQIAEVAAALADTEAPVVLVGERAGAGALAAAGRLADVVGGSVAWIPRRPNVRGHLEHGMVAGLLPGGRRNDDDAARAEVAQAWGVDELPSDGNDLEAILTLAGKGKIDVLYLLGVDLVTDVPNQRLVNKALKKATVVTHDIVANATTPHADIVLPVTATQERHGSRTNWEGRRQTFNLGVDAPKLAQEDWEILVQLAGLLGHDLGFSDLDGIRSEIADLGRSDIVHDWPDITPEVSAGDHVALESYPLLLDHGVMQVNAEALAQTARENLARMHPQTAADRGIADGDLITLSSRRAEATVAVTLTVDQAPGTLFVPHNSGTEGLTALAAEVTVEAVPSQDHDADTAQLEEVSA